MRRYYVRFIHLLPNLQKLGGILRTTYNQYDSVALPMENWLKEQGVHFDMNTRVTDIDFDIASDKLTATVIHYIRSLSGFRPKNPPKSTSGETEPD